MDGHDRYWHGWYQRDSGLWQEWHWDTLQSRWVEGPSPDAWYYQWTGSRGRTWEANNDWEMAEASDSADDDAPSAVAEVLWADPDDADAFEVAETRRDQDDLAAINAVREEADAQRSAVAENPQDVAGQRFHGSLLNAAYDRFEHPDQQTSNNSLSSLPATSSRHEPESDAQFEASRLWSSEPSRFTLMERLRQENEAAVAAATTAAAANQVAARSCLKRSPSPRSSKRKKGIVPYL